MLNAASQKRSYWGRGGKLNSHFHCFNEQSLTPFLPLHWSKKLQDSGLLYVSVREKRNTLNTVVLCPSCQLDENTTFLKMLVKYQRAPPEKSIARKTALRYCQACKQKNPPEACFPNYSSSLPRPKAAEYMLAFGCLSEPNNDYY